MEFHLKLISSTFAGEKTLLAVDKQGRGFRQIRETLEKLLEAFEAGERAKALAVNLETRLTDLEEEYAWLWEQSLDSITEELQTKGK